jgi:hypothetical protein
MDSGARWDIEYTDEFAAWWDTLTTAEQRAIIAAVEALEAAGPSLGRPFADTVRGSRHANMKELRPRGGTIRIFFAFDPRRTAILLIGGDKRHRWAEFYDEMIPIADDLYDDHLRTLREEGAIP